MPLPRARAAAPAAFLATALALLSLTGCQGPDQTGGGAAPGGIREDGVIRVPAEVASLTEAEALAEPGDLLLIAPGSYDEQLLITTPDITIRGEDRSGTVIDGGGVRPFGIVAMADGVRVENLTVTNATFYGLLFTGLHDESGPSAPTANDYEPWDPADFPPLQRFLADHVTAVNNGLYGVYAFNAQHGIIRDSYASGSADSGFYVGQCTECDILVTGNVAERNAVGFENSNASDSVVIAGNRFTGNRIGMTLLSSYQEAFLPQKGNIVVGNLVSGNDEAETPAHALGGFGTGIGISGGVGNLIVRNAIEDHVRAGVLFDSAEDLAALGNAFVDNALSGNRIDFANVSAERAAASGNCVSGSPSPTALPEGFADELISPSCAPASGAAVAQSAAADIGGPEAPDGISFRKVALPVDQPNLPQADSYGALPERVEMPSIERFPLPDGTLLIERIGTR